MLVHNVSVDGHGNGTCGESFYRAMSSKEYERLKENDYHLSKRHKGSSELKITDSEAYVVSDLSQRKGKKKEYAEILRFDVKEGTKVGLKSMGGVINGPIEDYENFPIFKNGMVQIKQERGGVISFGLGTSPKELSFFNEQIKSVFRYNYKKLSWESLI